MRLEHVVVGCLESFSPHLPIAYDYSFRPRTSNRKTRLHDPCAESREHPAAPRITSPPSGRSGLPNAYSRIPLTLKSSACNNGEEARNGQCMPCPKVPPTPTTRNTLARFMTRIHRMKPDARVMDVV